MSVLNIQDQLSAEFAHIQSKVNGAANSEFNKTRLASFEAFKNLGIPTPKHEDWKYSNLKGLDKNKYELNVAGSLTKNDLNTFSITTKSSNNICFVNGAFSESLSNIDSSEKIQVMSLQKALEICPEKVNEHFGKHISINSEGLSALNAALTTNGLVVFIADNVTVTEPIVLRYISDVQQSNISSTAHNLVVIGQNSEVKIVEIYNTIGQNSAFSNVVSEIVVGPEARVDYYKIQDENDASYHVGTTQIVQKTKSYFYAATVTVNGGFVRNNLNLILDGQHIENHLYGLYIPNASQHIDNHTIVDHQQPNCQSNELYKGVLMDKSTGVFNGKIFVREDAQKTNAYQNCRNVITSDSATMNSKPQLEIWADDVKCSHGTTTGKLNDEAIFYMQSRGIPKAEAVKLQLLAFAEDVISQIKIEAIKEQLEVLIEAKLK
jgi:Fe-S cluster assembly protein SufD